MSDTSESELHPQNAEEDADIRNRWRRLVDRELPDAARQSKDWPVIHNHCFARILLDNACTVPWRTAIQPPAWRNTPLPVLQSAIDLGEEIITGEADIWALNNRSLIMRSKAPRTKKPTVS